MRLETVKVAELITPDNNIRKHPDKQVAEIAKSFKMFGQIRPVVIDEENYIWAGNGFVEAMRREGVAEIEAYRIVGLTDNQKKKLMLADNKTYALGADNLAALDDVMKSLDDFDIPGYDPDILADLYSDDGIGAVMQSPVEPVMAPAYVQSADATNGYGVIPTETVQSINVRAETPPAVAAVPVAAPPVAGEKVEEWEHAPAAVKKFVVCPRCGEKVWL